MKNRLEVLVGTIASGKSTYCRGRAAEGAIIINDDAIVTMVHGDYRKYDKELKPLYRSIELSIMCLALNAGRDVIIDRPNLKKSSRAKYAAPARAMEFDVAFVLFPFVDPSEHARRRMESDGRGYDQGYWERVASEQMGLYEPVSESEDYTVVRHN